MISDGGDVDLDEEEVHVDWDEEGDEQERGGSEQLVHLKVSLEIISKQTNDREGSPQVKSETKVKVTILAKRKERVKREKETEEEKET